MIGEHNFPLLWVFFLKFSTCASGQVSWKSTFPTAKFPRYGLEYECLDIHWSRKKDSRYNLRNWNEKFNCVFFSYRADSDRQAGLSEWLEEVYGGSEVCGVENQRLAVAAKIVEEMRAAVYKDTGFRCSAGIAHNKVSVMIRSCLHWVYSHIHWVPVTTSRKDAKVT